MASAAPGAPTLPPPVTLPWVSITDKGLWLPDADLYIDPLRPVANAVITHGHADHARAGHRTVHATPQTLSIMEARYGPGFCETAVPHAYGEAFGSGRLVVDLHPAGHIWGSAQVRVRNAGQTLVVSGDYKRHADPTCPPFVPLPCDVFVTEATFALPVFTHPPLAQEIQRLLASRAVFAADRCVLVGCYALGKAQRLILALRAAGYERTIFLHGALMKLCQLYIEQGFDLGDLAPVPAGKEARGLTGEIVLCPPSALDDRWSRRLPEPVTAMASGWMRVRARARQRRCDLPLIISDHADWPDLLRTIREVNPRTVWVTHGREDALVHACQTQLGIPAQALNLVGYEEEGE